MQSGNAENEGPESVVKGEHHWPAAVAVLVALALYVTLPHQLTPGPLWLLPALVTVLLVPVVILAPRRHPGEGQFTRGMAIVLIALINTANVVSLILLIDQLTHGSHAAGRTLLIAAIQIWLTNVIVFGLWYWELDRGGPGMRALTEHRAPDFLFPQMSNPQFAPKGWRPTFIDYLYVGLTNAAAFSPTDTMPLTPRAKTLMGIQSLASILTVAFVAGRAVNIL
ncbi:MAG: hypothetical protein M3Z66_22060 [Chloroflexota bacterium]|nr:hypothetical protein [Chloroflexota bacterium]